MDYRRNSCGVGRVVRSVFSLYPGACAVASNCVVRVGCSVRSSDFVLVS